MIELCELIEGREIDDCKIHLASWNKHDHPLDVFVKDREQWKEWNEYRGKRNDFNRKYIFSLIQFLSRTRYVAFRWVMACGKAP